MTPELESSFFGAKFGGDIILGAAQFHELTMQKEIADQAGDGGAKANIENIPVIVVHHVIEKDADRRPAQGAE